MRNAGFSKSFDEFNPRCDANRFGLILEAISWADLDNTDRCWNRHGLSRFLKQFSADEHSSNLRGAGADFIEFRISE